MSSSLHTALQPSIVLTLYETRALCFVQRLWSAHAISDRTLRTNCSCTQTFLGGYLTDLVQERVSSETLVSARHVIPERTLHKALFAFTNTMHRSRALLPSISHARERLNAHSTRAETCHVHVSVTSILCTCVLF